MTAPERVERVALLCTSAGGAGGSSYPLHELVDLVPEERQRVYTSILDTRFTAEFLAGDARSRAIEVLAGRIAEERSPAQRAGEAARSPPVAVTTCGTACRASRVPRSWRAAASTASPRSPTARPYAAHVPDAELRTYDGGHVFFLQTVLRHARDPRLPRHLSPGPAGPDPEPRRVVVRWCTATRRGSPRTPRWPARPMERAWRTLRARPPEGAGGAPGEWRWS